MSIITKKYREVIKIFKNLSFKNIFSKNQKLNKIDKLDFAVDSKVEVIFNEILDYAIKVDCTDIHLEPQEKIGIIRLRINGKLERYKEIDISTFTNLLTYIKLKNEINISEKRLPQDGRMSEDNLDIRASSIPTMFGEKIVLRLLNRKNFLKDKKELGFLEEDIEFLEEIIKNKEGLLIITGKTGSGKTTTAYSIIKDLIKENINIMSIEDPIEYNLCGINQIQVNKKAGLNFENGLKSILRQDPDVILVGEIRDEITAKIALKASMSGHLVISTMHSNNAISSIIRLLEMNIEPYVINSSLIGIINQKIDKADENVKLSYEILKVNDYLKEVIVDKPSYLQIKNKAIELDLLRCNSLESVK